MPVLKLAGIVWESIVDGPGIRCTVFAQGCPHRCPGCHNPQTWSFTGGFEMEPRAIIDRMALNPLLHGITLSGGEPFCQPAAMAELARLAHDAGYDVITYTGFTFEELVGIAQQEGVTPGDDASSVYQLLNYTDTIIDGRFERDKRRIDLPFRGSENQRVLTVKNELAEYGKLLAG